MSETEEKMNHLDEMTCLLYLERQLDRARGLEVSLHTQECESCRTLLRALGVSFPHERMGELPPPAAGARARITAADPGDVRGQRTAAVAAGAIPGGSAALHAMDLGTGVWVGGNRRVC